MYYFFSLFIVALGCYCSPGRQAGKKVVVIRQLDEEYYEVRVVSYALFLFHIYCGFRSLLFSKAVKPAKRS